MPIAFFAQKIPFPIPHPRILKKWLGSVMEQHKQTLYHLNYIFCNDAYLHALNQQYLGHDTYTDVITFDHAAPKQAIWGDIYISIPRVKENAGKFQTLFYQELCRVMVHGLLHLMGYDDQTAEKQAHMRAAEDRYLASSLLQPLYNTKGECTPLAKIPWERKSISMVKK